MDAFVLLGRTNNRRKQTACKNEKSLGRLISLLFRE